MKILFAAPENAWAGFFHKIRSTLPEHSFEASGRFEIGTLEGFDVLVPTMSLVTRDVLRGADRLRLIQQCGAGLEGVDLAAAREQNIPVANVPTDISGNADSVAELGIYMLIGLSRDFRGMARSHRDRKVGEPKGRALKGKTVGIVGLGGIGRALVHRLRPFGVRLMGIKRNDPEKAMEELGLVWAGGPGDLPRLLARSDYVVLALPMTEESRGMIDGAAFSRMKRESFIINLSRGGLIEREALIDALASGRIAGAGLDVYWEEPPDPDDPLFRYNVLATPHIAGSTDISVRGIVEAVAENIRRVERGDVPLHVKN